MSLQGILIYSLRAGGFAAAVCGVYAIICLLRKRKLSFRLMAAVAYIAALIQITVLRGGVDWQAVQAGVHKLPQLIPLKTTLSLAQIGGWDFIYNTMGNLIWFVPLGLLMGKGRPLSALGLGAAVSAGIEIFQSLLMTGQTDVDDIILNAIGAWIGWGLYRLYLKNKKGSAN